MKYLMKTWFAVLLLFVGVGMSRAEDTVGVAPVDTTRKASSVEVVSELSSEQEKTCKNAGSVDVAIVKEESLEKDVPVETPAVEDEEETMPIGSVNGFSSDFDNWDEGDRISDVLDANRDKTVIYNMQGMRINKLQKGLNIVNGRKILKW